MPENIKMLYLDYSPTNTAARETYSKLGFEEIAERYIGYDLIADDQIKRAFSPEIWPSKFKENSKKQD